MDTCNKPLAAPGLLSYRYRGRYGWIMLGAKNDSDALIEARRSTADPVIIDRLQRREGTKYVSAI